MNRILLLSFMLWGGICLQAKKYTIQDIPMVHLEDRMRYVSNPDSILSDSIVTMMDSMLYALEEKTGIQTMVVVVTGIEGGDCFDFAHRLGMEKGVGQQGRDNGLVILLSTEERCVQFATGYGLEGALPDAICKRIQSQYMVSHFGKDDWNTGMLEGIRAAVGYLDGSMTNELEEEGESDMGFIIMGLLFLSPVFLFLYKAFRSSKPRCPQCKKRNTTVTATKVLSQTKEYEEVEKQYACEDCGHTFIKIEKHYFQKAADSGNSSAKFGGSNTGGADKPRGGSYGGGKFGGGGAGSKF
jgi:uncharacterized protein